jgi:hypothetical protein
VQRFQLHDATDILQNGFFVNLTRQLGGRAADHEAVQ